MYRVVFLTGPPKKVKVKLNFLQSDFDLVLPQQIFSGVILVINLVAFCVGGGPVRN